MWTRSSNSYSVIRSQVTMTQPCTTEWLPSETKYSCEATLLTLGSKLWTGRSSWQFFLPIWVSIWLFMSCTYHKEAGGYGFGNRSMDLMRSFFDGRLNNKNKNNIWPHKWANPHHVCWRPSALRSWRDSLDCRIKAQNTGPLSVVLV